MQQYRVMIYCRYRDDILIVYEEEKGYQEYMNEMKQKARGVWTLKLEGQSEERIYYLDITISKENCSKGKDFYSTNRTSRAQAKRPH